MLDLSPEQNEQLEQVESFLKAEILPKLEAGRPKYDAPHTEAVVLKLKQIITESSDLQLDIPVLIIAAYAHDWGYAGFFEEGKPANLDSVLNAKAGHMVEGAKRIGELLEGEVFSFLTLEQKERCVHLVLVHDKVDSLTAPDELVLMEADTLGSMDPSLVEFTFNKADLLRHIEKSKNWRLPKFITEAGKSEFERLYALMEDHISKMES